MDKQTSEQAIRREAIGRILKGERKCDICRELERTPQWLNKWWRKYQHFPGTDFADRSRAPHTSPQQISADIEYAVVSIRQLLEDANTPETRYGLIGNRAIQAQLSALEIKPIPSTATIQRVLAKHDLTYPLGAGIDSVYYPWPVAWEVNAIHATDIITRHLRGGQEIENFHTIDHYSHAVHLTQHSDKTSATTCEHLLKTWGKLGFPLIQQFDNEGAFCGGHTHPRIIGRVVRLCLYCGIEVFFTPIYEAKRNHQIETFHSVWLAGFWSRHEFAAPDEVQAEQPLFLHWYHHDYHPPLLNGRTPAQMRHGFSITRLTTELRGRLPQLKNERLPITAGRFHIMRKVDRMGQVGLLNETWPVGKKWTGQYVRATINTANETLTFWHKVDDTSEWQLIKSRDFSLKETIHDLLPAFRRNQKRCRDYLPG